MRARPNLRTTTQGEGSGHEAAGPLPFRALLSRKGWVAVGRTFRMDWRMVDRDIALGIAIAGTLAAVEGLFRFGGWIPDPPAPGTALEKDYFAWDYTPVLNALLVPLGLGPAHLGRPED